MSPIVSSGASITAGTIPDTALVATTLVKSATAPILTGTNITGIPSTAILAGNIAPQMTFNTVLPTSTLTPSLASQLVTKAYADSKALPTGTYTNQGLIWNNTTLTWVVQPVLYSFVCGSLSSAGSQTVALGYNSKSGNYSVSVGCNSSAGNQTVAIGESAGNSTKLRSVCIGNAAGNNTTANDTVSVGNQTGNVALSGSIAIGACSQYVGGTVSGVNSIGIGFNCPTVPTNSIYLYAMGVQVLQVLPSTNAFYVNPVRTDNTKTTTNYPLTYNSTTNEIAYNTSINKCASLANNGTINNYTLDLTTATEFFLTGNTGTLIIKIINCGTDTTAKCFCKIKYVTSAFQYCSANITTYSDAGTTQILLSQGAPMFDTLNKPNNIASSTVMTQDFDLIRGTTNYMISNVKAYL